MQTIYPIAEPDAWQAAEHEHGPAIVYEKLEGGSEQYPHIYGPLNLDAVTAVRRWRAQVHWRYRLPLSGP